MICILRAFGSPTVERKCPGPLLKVWPCASVGLNSLLALHAGSGASPSAASHSAGKE